MFLRLSKSFFICEFANNNELFNLYFLQLNIYGLICLDQLNDEYMFQCLKILFYCIEISY